MKKILAIVFVSLISASTVFAKPVTIYKVQGEMQWRFDDEYHELDVYPIEPHPISIYVNSFIDVHGSHLAADLVTLNCDGVISE